MLELAGFTTQRLTATLSAGGTAQLAARMPVGTLSETVTVTSESAAIGTSLGGRVRVPPRDVGNESYKQSAENLFRQVLADPHSTFL